MSNKPKITIITPAYNAEKYIEEAIRSVQNQSFTDYEHIIIDDGSTDKTASIVKDFAREDHRIVYLKQKNQGPSIARNMGIDHATGGYITFLDADDLYAPETLAVASKKMFEGSPDIIFYDFVYYHGGDHAGPVPHKIDLESGLIYTKQDLADKIFNVFPILTCNKFINHDVLRHAKVQFNKKYVRYEDVDFSIRITLAAKTYAYADYTGYYYRIDNQSSETATNYKHPTQLLQILIELNKTIVKTYPDLKQSFDNYSINQAIANINMQERYAKAQQEVFVFAKEKVIPELGLGAISRDYLYNTDLFESFMAIKNGDFITLLKCRAELLKKHIEFQESSINELSVEVRNVRNDYTAYRTSSELRIDKLKQEINGVYNSFSWRLTKPLRIIGKIIKPTE